MSVNNTIEAQEAQRHIALHEFASLAILPNGNIVLVWRRGKCCGSTIIMNIANQEKWALSTDGGQSFSQSGVIGADTPFSQSISWLSYSPPDPSPNPFPGFRWSDEPNVTADPVDGTLYAVWLQYRVGDNNRTAAVYLSRGILNGGFLTWSQPTIVDNSYPNKYQFLPWVRVSRDHTVHVTYGAALPSGTLNREVGKFYVQSTDGGNSFSAPFWLTETYIQAATFMGDYDAMDIG